MFTLTPQPPYNFRRQQNFQINNQTQGDILFRVQENKTFLAIPSFGFLRPFESKSISLSALQQYTSSQLRIDSIQYIDELLIIDDNDYTWKEKNPGQLQCYYYNIDIKNGVNDQSSLLSGHKDTRQESFQQEQEIQQVFDPPSRAQSISEINLQYQQDFQPYQPLQQPPQQLNYQFQQSVPPHIEIKPPPKYIRQGTDKSQVTLRPSSSLRETEPNNYQDEFRNDTSNIPEFTQINQLEEPKIQESFLKQRGSSQSIIFQQDEQLKKKEERIKYQIEQLQKTKEAQQKELQELQFVAEFKNKENHKQPSQIYIWHLLLVSVISLILGASVKKLQQLF
ncbi:hypothetical protein pb186bvf_017116 [Paramecium bursaria]